MIAIADLDGSVYNKIDKVKVDMAFSDDSKFLVYNQVTEENKNMIHIYDIEKRKLQKSIVCPAKCCTISISSGGNFLAVGTI